MLQHGLDLILINHTSCHTASVSQSTLLFRRWLLGSCCQTRAYL